MGASISMVFKGLTMRVVFREIDSCETLGD